MSDLKRKFFANVKNIGKSITKRKLIIFESDDWGSNRINSKEDFEGLVKDGVLAEHVSHYDKNDTLERAIDLEMLFEVLSSVKDINGRHAVFTPFVNVANPDFEKIESSEFQYYYWEDFFHTLDRTGEKKAVLDMWNLGITNGIFDPAFHGREHLCVPLWMKHLQDEKSMVRKAFKHNFYSVPTKIELQELSAFRPALFFSETSQIPFLESSIIEGLNRMEQLFQQQPKAFCPPNGISHQLFDKASSLMGITAIMANRFRSEPTGIGTMKKKYYAYNAQNQWGQRYYYRNCMFEPTYSSRAVEICLLQMEAAFRWHKPAIISSHRVNYMGTMNPENRGTGLRQLSALLKSISLKWPDAEFISSNEFADILHNNK